MTQKQGYPKYVLVNYCVWEVGHSGSELPCGGNSETIPNHSLGVPHAFCLGEPVIPLKGLPKIWYPPPRKPNLEARWGVDIVKRPLSGAMVSYSMMVVAEGDEGW